RAGPARAFGGCGLEQPVRARLAHGRAAREGRRLAEADPLRSAGGRSHAGGSAPGTAAFHELGGSGADRARAQHARAGVVPAHRCTSLDLLNADVAVLGCPYSTPECLDDSRAPSSEAPDAIRFQSLRLAESFDHYYDFDFGGELMAGLRLSIVDCGDVWAVP